MSNRIFKIIARHSNGVAWDKKGTQYRKWTYLSQNAYETHGLRIVKRYGKYYTMEHYELQNGSWVRITVSYDNTAGPRGRLKVLNAPTPLSDMLLDK